AVFRNDPVSCKNSTVIKTCQAYLGYHLYATDSAADKAKILFSDQMNANAIYVNGTDSSLFVGVNCSCTEDNIFLAYTKYHTGNNSNTSSDDIESMYKGLAWMPSDSDSYQGNSTVTIRLPCKCDDDDWKYLSYIPQSEDTISSLVVQFDSNLTAFMDANNFSSENAILMDDTLYYIPIQQVNGVLLNSSMTIPRMVKERNKRSWSKVLTIMGVTGAGLILMIAIIAGFILRGRLPWRHKNHWMYLNRRPGPKRINISNSNSDIQISLSKETNNMIDPGKVISFRFEEVVTGTFSFSQKNFVSHSWYGSSYTACLRGQQFDIKKIQLAPNKLTSEFLKEVKNLRKLHHTNLASLIGYASNEVELLLIYESSEHGPLDNHLHDPTAKGLAPLTWNARLQIAIDIARGLEYIHDDSQFHYVHCGINTSSMLRDADVQGKVGEFGLSKLLETIGSAACVTKDTAKLAFMAPEFLNEGRSTFKTDVYSFGVVLFELLTGQRATTDSQNSTGKETPQRSAVPPMTLRMLKDFPRPLKISQITNWVDPNLFSVYPEHLFCKTAEIAQRCLEENPLMRPNMRDVVFSLSHILLESIEWDAALAGGSQVFSGLRQGR
ncbi:hypothetical protein KI387_025754, partial [Taxus chinensis]